MIFFFNPGDQHATKTATNIFSLTPENPSTWNVHMQNIILEDITIGGDILYTITAGNTWKLQCPRLKVKMLKTVHSPVRSKRPQTISKKVGCHHEAYACDTKTWS